MFDKFDNLGKIMIIHDLVFKNEINKSIVNTCDHIGIGRPCIIISEINDKMYLLPCTTKYKERHKDYLFKLYNNYYAFNYYLSNSNIKLNRIIEKEIFSNEILAELNKKAYYKLLKKLINLYSKNNIDLYYDEYYLIEKDIKIQIKKLENGLI